jgi:hypothetical protein
MKALLLCLTLCCGTLYAQSPASSPPLSPEERRLVLGQLYELRACRDEVRTYRDFVARDIEQDAREKANAERALELEQQATGIARQERDLAREKAALYEQMYRSLTKRPGVGCWVKRIFTLGMARCS